ncbi:hypothetical protein ACSBR1_025839 [Camellia fascicularis]
MSSKSFTPFDCLTYLTTTLLAISLHHWEIYVCLNPWISLQTNFLGRIPHGNQFETFDNSSYDGNLALCGFPLSKECEDNKTQLHPTPMFHREDDPTFACGFSWKVVQMGCRCGMVLGLAMGYLMFLIGKPKWFVRIAEGKQEKKGKRPHKGGNRHSGR